MAGYFRKSGKGSWRVEYSRGFDAQTGRRVRFSFTFTGTKKDAEEELARRIAEHARGIDIAPNRATVQEVLTAWLEDVQNRVKPSTHYRYSVLARQVGALIGNHRLADLRPTHIQGMHVALFAPRKDPKTGRALAPRAARTVLHHHRVLREALQWALRLQLVAVNAADAVKPPRAERAQLRTLSAEEARELVSRLEDAELQRLVYFALQTGLRIGEIAALRWEDVDLERGTATVLRSLQRLNRQIIIGTPKTERGKRTIPLDPGTVQVLRSQHAEQLRRKLAAGSAYVGGELRVRGVRADQLSLPTMGPTAEIFADEIGRPRPPHVLSTRFKRAATAAGFSGVRFHDLRHTMATMAMGAGLHPKIVSERLGHSRIQITLDTYSHTMPSMQREAADTLGALVPWPGAETRHA